MTELSFNFKIGAPVYCEDEKVGKLYRLVANPETGQVSKLVIRIGLLMPTERLVPVSVVGQATEERIQLAVGVQELEDFVEYKIIDSELPNGEEPSRIGKVLRPSQVHVTRYGLPVPRNVLPSIRHTVPVANQPDLALVERGTRVENGKKTIGRVDHLLVNSETQKITHIVVDQGLFGRSIVIPQDLVVDYSTQRILITAGKDDLAQLPRYAPRDAAQILADLQSQLLEASFDLMAVKASILENGVVQLTGVVPDQDAKQEAEDIVWQVEGVLDVANLLETDSMIEARVKEALAEDQRVRTVESIEVISRQGLVTLEGEIYDSAQRLAAEQIAVRQPGVFTVVNALDAESQPVDESQFRPAEHT